MNLGQIKEGTFENDVHMEVALTGKKKNISPQKPDPGSNINAKTKQDTDGEGNTE